MGGDGSLGDVSAAVKIGSFTFETTSSSSTTSLSLGNTCCPELLKSFTTTLSPSSKQASISKIWFSTADEKEVISDWEYILVKSVVMEHQIACVGKLMCSGWSG